MLKDAFFTLSKLVIPLLDPGTWLLLAPLVALWFMWRSRYRAAAWTIATTVVIALLVFKLPTGAVLIRPLEQAIPAPVEMPRKIDGIISLAGALNPALTQAYERPQMGADAERITEFVALARAHPTARLVFAGDTGFVSPQSINEAEVMKRFLVGQGIDPGRVVFESNSRNTHESALATYELIQPGPGEAWLLITSAFHMPRAYGAFRKTGWNVIPYPVSYTARPTFSFDEGGYGLLALAIHEWVGLAVYRMTGRI
jgi:uncharacterized SAM-binding protein YcdF (DUF218 family)